MYYTLRFWLTYQNYQKIVVFINCVFCKHLLCKIDIQNKIHVNDAARSKSIIQDIKSTINDNQKSY